MGSKSIGDHRFHIKEKNISLDSAQVLLFFYFNDADFPAVESRKAIFLLFFSSLFLFFFLILFGYSCLDLQNKGLKPHETNHEILQFPPTVQTHASFQLHQELKMFTAGFSLVRGPATPCQRVQVVTRLHSDSSD